MTTTDPGISYFQTLRLAPAIPVKRLHHEAVLPGQGREGDAGYDLTAPHGGILDAGERADFGTGLAVAIPEGYVGLIKPRSGLALRSGIDVLGGVIDSGYRGEIRVILFNTSDTDFIVSDGDRIAQLVVQPVAQPIYTEVYELPESVRAEGGFGSTGVR